ncbi:MAG: hypothetical protein JW837_17525 [Sedimentisphaerales bacterium]|nr:hypothetical protein [Sedimentisphaerales bacterium]
MENNKQKLNCNFNLNNLLIGFLLALCLLLTIGAMGNNYSSQRYQCCAAGNEPLAVFVIDTETGQTWRLSRTDTYDFGSPSAPKSIRQSIKPMLD